jgi:hypothetical protein
MHINTSAVVMFTFMLALPPRGLFYYNIRPVTLQALLRGAGKNCPDSTLSAKPPVFPKNRETFGRIRHLFIRFFVYTV